MSPQWARPNHALKKMESGQLPSPGKTSLMIRLPRLNWGKKLFVPRVKIKYICTHGTIKQCKICVLDYGKVKPNLQKLQRSNLCNIPWYASTYIIPH